MRNVLGWVAYVLGPVIGLSYEAFMWSANLGKSRWRRWVHMTEERASIEMLTVPLARCVPKGRSAVTLGRRCYLRGQAISAELLFHEAVHAQQVKQMGRLWFYAVYARELVLRGYRGNRLEAEAREKAGI